MLLWFAAVCAFLWLINFLGYERTGGDLSTLLWMETFELLPRQGYYNQCCYEHSRTDLLVDI